MRVVYTEDTVFRVPIFLPVLGSGVLVLLAPVQSLSLAQCLKKKKKKKRVQVQN